MPRERDEEDQAMDVSSIVVTTTTSTTLSPGQKKHGFPRLVSAHPLFSGATIETMIEATVDNRFRVVIRNGPEMAVSLIHASFLLPEPTQFPTTTEDDTPPPSLLAWTHFTPGETADSTSQKGDSTSQKKKQQPKTPQSTFLCVLAHPTLLTIYNVYPQSSSSAEWTVQQESWTVPLPLECASVFAIPRSGGLLLQRLPDASELDQVLLEPPPNSGFSSSEGANDNDNTGFPTVPALFTLLHYQKDLMPLTDQAGLPWNDPLEQVLWIGESVKYTDDTDNDTSSIILIVTHHSRWQRHAIWSLEPAPPPPKPPSLPMYYAARHNYHTTAASANSTTFPTALLWQDNDHDEQAMPVVSSQIKQTRRSLAADYSRQDALADALGVPMAASITARNPFHHKTPRHSIASSLPGASAPHAQRSLFSPNTNETPLFLETTSTAPPEPSSTNFFSTIHSHHVTHRLYQETNRASPLPAMRVFLISNVKATALDVLVWLVVVDETNKGPRRGPRAVPLKRPNEQKRRACLFQMIRTNKNNAKRMEPLLEHHVVCRDAQPVQATPLLHPGLHKCGDSLSPTTTKVVKATDWLVLRGNGTLVLYRAQIPLTRIRATDHTTTITSAFTDPVGHRLGLVQGSNIRRVSIQLSLPCPRAERALCAIQHSLQGDPEWANRALLLRADVLRVYQRLVRQAPSTWTGLPYKALAAVLVSLVQLDMGVPVHDGNLVRKITEPTLSSWQALQASEYGSDHEIFPHELPEKKETENPGQMLPSIYLNSSPQFWRHAQQHKGRRGNLTSHIFDSLHLLLEDSKLSNRACPADLVSLLLQLCQMFPQNDLQQAFLHHYQYSSLEACQHLAGATEMVTEPESSIPFTKFEEPPSIMHWVESVLGGKRKRNFFESIRPQQMNPTCFHIWFVLQALPLLCQSGDEAASRVVQILVEDGFTEQLSISEVFVPGVAFPLLTLLNKLTNEASEKNMTGLSPEGFALIGRNDLSLNMGGMNLSQTISLPPPPTPPSAAIERDSEESPHGGGTFSDQDKDGLVPLEVSSSMLFPDNRVHEAARLLRSSRPIFLRVPRVVEITDHEYEQLKQRRLALLVRRALALPFGRGMMTLGSLKPLAAESLPLPELCLKGRVPPTNATLSLDQAEFPQELKVWPEFHNGVAAGLRVPLQSEGQPSSQITRTWILFNKPPRNEAPNPEETNNNNNTPAIVNNTKSHAHGGFLLALGLRGHLTALEMTDIYEYLTQGTVTITVGVLLGMSANKRGSCDMSVSKMLCLHIPSLIPQHFSAIDVASAVQSAAVTGIGLLYQGSSHRMMTEFLLNEIGKRPESDTSAFDREAYTLSCGIALGMVNLCIGEKAGHVDRAAGISDLRVEERLRRYINGGQSNEEEARRIQESNDRFSIPSSSNGIENEKCSIIYEANMINTDVTAPAATLALGLMYMKSGNQTIASAVSIPQTHFLLEFVRPDFLGLRVVARSLILWEDVEPTLTWIEKQVPEVVRTAYLSMRAIAKRTMEGHNPIKSQRAVDYDRRAVRQIYANIVAGACFSVGLRHAGTGDERAKKALFDCVLQMHKLREGNDPVSVVSKPEFPILETCLGLTAISLAMVLAGTGDLDALRLFKVLRWRDKDVVYGTHMVFAAATGLLFLGGGTMTLGRNPEDIAALVAAFFPRFPAESVDNQYHLQALRHLYALAAKRSEICAIDVDTGERVYVSVETLAEGRVKPQAMRVPFLMRNTDVPIRALKVVSDDFYPLTVRLFPGTNIFHVKRKRSAESNMGDLATAELLSQLEYLSLSGADGPFIQKLISGQHGKNRYGVLLLFLSLMNGLRSIGRNSFAPIKLMWDLRVLRSFNENGVLQLRAKEFSPEIELLAFLLERAYQQLVLVSANMDTTERSLLVSVLYT